MAELSQQNKDLTQQMQTQSQLLTQLMSQIAASSTPSTPVLPHARLPGMANFSLSADPFARPAYASSQASSLLLRPPSAINPLGKASDLNRLEERTGRIEEAASKEDVKRIWFAPAPGKLNMLHKQLVYALREFGEQEVAFAPGVLGGALCQAMYGTNDAF